MTESATGLVLRIRSLTETSLIVHWLTRDLGRLATVAKGARRAKSPFRGKLDLFYRVDLSFNRSRRSDLHTLREVNVLDTHPALRTDLGYLRQAAYCAGLVEQTTETDTPLPAFFALIEELLCYLPGHPPEPQTIFAFELKLLNHLGLQPDLNQTKLDAGLRQVVRALTESDWPAIARLRLSAPQVNNLNRFLHGFLIFHLTSMPKFRQAALGLGLIHPETQVRH
ncbi:MAG TPA: DNA repair protein RecO [Verrucomicrobiae bacterium]|nr:DNA repair protein RecO [Verrucomicrobiae bacterium]